MNSTYAGTQRMQTGGYSPEIAEMQAGAIITATLEVRREKGYDIVPEIMIPLTGIKRRTGLRKKDSC